MSTETARVKAWSRKERNKILQYNSNFLAKIKGAKRDNSPKTWQFKGDNLHDNRLKQVYKKHNPNTGNTFIEHWYNLL